MTTSPAEKKHLRRIGHKLKPVVIIANKGITEAVSAEIDRALTDHELIKVKLATGSREIKKLLIDEICSSLKAEPVQMIGNILLLYRVTKKPNPKLSNLLRP
jgi:RNA-binding protein